MLAYLKKRYLNIITPEYELKKVLKNNNIKFRYTKETTLTEYQPFTDVFRITSGNDYFVLEFEVFNSEVLGNSITLNIDYEDEEHSNMFSVEEYMDFIKHLNGAFKKYKGLALSKKINALILYKNNFKSI